MARVLGEKRAQILRIILRKNGQDLVIWKWENEFKRKQIWWPKYWESRVSRDEDRCGNNLRILIRKGREEERKPKKEAGKEW